jgi:hypothetical protein
MPRQVIAGLFRVKSKIAFSLSLKALKKSVAEKIGGEKNGFLKLSLSQLDKKKVRFWFEIFFFIYTKDYAKGKKFEKKYFMFIFSTKTRQVIL